MSLTPEERAAVVAGIVPLEYGHFYSQLFSMRMTGDYDDFNCLTQEEVEPLIEKTANFISFVKGLIDQQ